MQSLFKGTLNSLKLSGLNAHMFARGFARMTGRNKKTFAQALERAEEPEEFQVQAQDLKQPVKGPEDFEEDAPVVKKAAKTKPEKKQAKQPEIVNEDSAMAFQTSFDQLVGLEDRYKAFDKETKKFVKDELLYPGYDPHPEKLVQRPQKDVVWGLGGQLMKRKTKFFEYGKMPEIDEIIAFLEMEHAKDVVLVDLLELGRTDLPQYGIILTAFSSRHMHRIGTSLVKCIKEIEIPELINPPRLHGRKDDDWIMVSFKNVMVHMFTEESRLDLDLENKWRNPPQSDDEVDYDEMKKENKKPKLYQTYKGE